MEAGTLLARAFCFLRCALKLVSVLKIDGGTQDSSHYPGRFGGRTDSSFCTTMAILTRSERHLLVPVALCCLLLQVSVAFSCTARDRAALLSFKRGTERDNTGLLDSWLAGGDCCTFYGVSCNSQGRVVNLTIVVPPIGDDCDGGCPNLQRIENQTNLIGKTLSKLSALEVLYLGNFDVIEDVTPTGLSALKGLKVLRLEDARFAGTLSADIGKITSLEYLSFAGNTEIVGPLPASLCGLVNLTTLNLTSGFPDFFAFLNGSLPSCIGNLQKLEYLFSEYGHLSGPIPASFFNLKNLKEVRLSGNDLSGQLPDLRFPGLTVLHLDGNPFVGPIPTYYGSLLSLVELRLGGLNVTAEVANQFTNLVGTLPSALGNLFKLQVLVIRATKIAGVIPASIGNLINLVDLELDHNQLTGRVPDLSKLTKLQILNLEGNHFVN